MKIEFLRVTTFQEVKITISTSNHDSKYIAFMGKIKFTTKIKHTTRAYVSSTIKPHIKTIMECYEDLLDG